MQQSINHAKKNIERGHLYLLIYAETKRGSRYASILQDLSMSCDHGELQVLLKER